MLELVERISDLEDRYWGILMLPSIVEDAGLEVETERVKKVEEARVLLREARELIVRWCGGEDVENEIRDRVERAERLLEEVIRK
jgi:PP-loop superfamily ATP-utilizing enzyme